MRRTWVFSASFIFSVGIKGKVCLIQADSADLIEDGSVRFVIHNDSKSVVAAFKDYEFFYIEDVT